MTSRTSRAQRILCIGVSSVLLSAGVHALTITPAAAEPPGTTVRASQTEAGGQIPVGVDGFQAISGDGNVIAFVTSAALVEADANTGSDLYRRNLATGVVDLVTINASGAAVGDMPEGTYDIDLDQDGSHVAFESHANGIVANDANGQRDIFVRDFTGTPTTVQVNVNDDGTPAASPNGATGLSISDDGSRVAFMSYTTLINTTGGGNSGITIRDLVLSDTIHVSTDNTAGSHVAISGDGLSVAYTALTTVNPVGPVYSRVVKVWTGGVERDINATGPTGVPLDTSPVAFVGGPDALSQDGSALAFISDQVDLVTGDTNGTRDGFLAQISTEGPVTVTRVTVGDDEAEGTGTSAATGISSDGTRVVFASTSSFVVASGFQVYVRDTVAGTTTPASVSSSGVISNSSSYGPRMSRDSAVVSFISDATNLVTGDTNAARDVFAHTVGPPLGPVAPTDVNLSIRGAEGVYGTPPGASEVPVSAIPPTALPLNTLADIAGAPLRSVDLAASPLRSVPLRSVPLRSVPLRSVPLRSVTLSDIPLRSVGASWETVLATLNPNPFAGVPLQSITLDQVLDAFDAQPTATGLNSVTLGDIDLASTPLRSVTMASLALGATPLRSVPIEDTGGTVPATGAAAFAAWCAMLVDLGYSCEALGLTQDSPILALDLAGVPLRSVPLRSVPLRSVDLSSAPLRSVPLRSVNFAGIPLGGLLLSAIDATKLSTIVTCVSCPATLGEVAALSPSGLAETATLGTLFDAVDPAALPGSLLELLQGLINVSDYPWEQLPLNDVGVADFQVGGPTITYQLDFELLGSGPAPTTASVTLPPGFRYVLNSGVDQFDEAALPNPAISGRTLTWTLPDQVGGDIKRFLFDVRPGLDLGEYLSEATVSAGGVDVSVVETAAVEVLEEREVSTGSCEIGCTNNDPTGAADVAGNTLYISHIGTAGDVDYYRLPAPAKGTRIQVALGVPDGADFDVAMFNGAATPLRSVPLRSVPLRSVPLTDDGLGTDASSTSLSPETLNDIPTIEGTPLRSVSENRSSAEEVINTTSDASASTGTGGYTLQVSGFNGSRSDQPYVLYVKQYAPPTPPSCPARQFDFTGAPGTAPSSLGTDRKTLFLVSRARLGATYGTGPADEVLAKLDTLSLRGDVLGLVYPIEGKASVAAAFAAWDAEPCDVDLANAVFSAVATIVDDVRAANPTLQNVVVVGSDDLIPMARVADYTQLSNESDYADSTVKGDGTGTPIAAASAGENILTDDPLGVTAPIGWLDHQLYVPDIGVGRLVETPGAIIDQIDQFIAADGKLDPTTALTTGYDFLSDGATTVNAALPARIPAASRLTLINETWTRADVNAMLFPSTGAPGIANVNAHYDHARSLPALGNSTADETDLFTVADVDAHPQALVRRILFTMGCHAGLNLPDTYLEAGSDKAQDWVQTYQGSGQKAAVYFANTGFGYGDTATVALSEQLMTMFAQRLDGSMTVGQAAAFAKQAYFGQLGAYGPYDEKAMQEATFYGLPMYTVGNATPAAITKVNPAADANGILSHPVSITPTFTQLTSPGGGTFHTIAGEAQVTQYRPIVPRTSVPITPTSTGLVAHGFLTTALTSRDIAVVPAVARPVIDLSTVERAPTSGEVAFPTTFSNLTSFQTPTGTEQRLVLLPGQVFRDEAWEGSGAVERLFDSIAGQVKYSTSGDFTQPFLTNVVATLTAGTLSLGLDATDDIGDIVTVLVLVKDESGLWRSVTLTKNLSTGRYEGTLGSIVGTQIEYFAQAQDDAGNVGITTNKGRYYGALVPGGAGAQPPPLLLTTTPGEPTGDGGWYRSGVGVEITGAASYTMSIDGAAPTTYTGPRTITADGTHLVKATGDDGSSAMLVVPVDSTTPTLTLGGVTAGGQYMTAPTPTCTATDATSGVASCTVTITGGDATHTRGTLTATATAYDYAGNTVVKTATYTAGYRFAGFLQPINDTGHNITANTSIFKAGSTVPVRFQILDPNGNPVQLAQAPTWITPVRSGPLNLPPNEATVTAKATTGSGLTYDAGSKTYSYNWKTDKRDAGFYYKIGARLADGTVFWTYIGLR